MSDDIAMCGCEREPHTCAEGDARAERVPLVELQRESAAVNDLNGVVAFCAGVFAEVMRCQSLAEAQTCAELGMQALGEYHAGLWRPGPHDDPADWRKT